MLELLKLSAIIVIILLAGIGLTIGSCAFSDYMAREKENQYPLLKAMKIWEKQNGHPSSDNNASSVALKFIPIGTSAEKAFNTLKENGFTPIPSEFNRLTEAMRAKYTRYGTPCRTDYEVALEFKNAKVSKTNSEITYTCL